MSGPTEASGPGPVGSARTAVVWSVLGAELDRRGGTLAVLDVGGGTGGFAVPLAQRGHTVTVVDPSPDALATLDRRARAAGVGDRIRARQGDTETLPELMGGAAVDLVLAHSVLEVVDDPARTPSQLAGVLRPAGALSLVVANRVAAVLARAVGGHVGEARRALDDPDGRWGDGDGTARRFDADRLVDLVTAAGYTVESLHGVRVLTDLVPGAVADRAGESLRELEVALAARPPYRDIAAQLHLLARRP